MTSPTNKANGRRPVMFTAERKMLELARREAGATASTAPADNEELLAAIGAMLKPMEARLDDLARQVAEATIAPAAAEGPQAAEDPAPEGPEAPEMRDEAPGDEMRLMKTEIRALQHCIEETRQEIAALHKSGEAKDRLSLLKDELDAIVGDTETATSSILDCMEKIDEAAHQLRSCIQNDPMAQRLAETIIDVSTQVFEYCNFQDLSGQRITKVVNTLKYIEERVNTIIGIWGEEALAEIDVPTDDAAFRGQDDLERVINTSRENTERVNQDDIDAMFD